MNPAIPPASEIETRPSVVLWYRVYCIGMVLLYVLCVIAGVLLLKYEPGHSEEDRQTMRWLGWLMSVMSSPLIVIFAAGLAVPRQKWGWICGIVLIAIGLTGFTAIFSVLLLVFWLRSDCKAWFGMVQPPSLPLPVWPPVPPSRPPSLPPYQQ